MARSPTPSGAFQFLNGVAAVSTDDVWAVGSDQSGSPSATLAAHWNGSKWRIVPTPPGTGGERALHAVTASGPNDVWAVGDDLPGGSVSAASGVTEHWDGSHWTEVPAAASPRTGGDRLFGVATLGPNDVWAVGEAASARTGRQFTLTERWDGSAWTVVDSPNVAVQNTLLGVAALAPGTLWAVGGHDAATGCCLRTLTLRTRKG